MSPRRHEDRGVSEEHPRRTTAFPRSSGRRLTVWSRSAHGVLVACKELSLCIDGVRTARTERPIRFYGVYTECVRASQEKSTGILCRNMMYLPIIISESYLLHTHTRARTQTQTHFYHSVRVSLGENFI